MAAYHARRKRNNRKPLTAEQRDLAGRYVPLARSIAKPFKGKWPSLWEEFDSASLLALVEAAESYDATCNVRFATFARLRVVGAMKDVLRRAVSTSEHEQPSSVYTVGRGDARHLESIGALLSTTPDPEVGHDIEQVDAVEAWLRKLPPKHAKACRHIYLGGCSQVEAARRMGCSQSRLSYLHREALAMLNGSWYVNAAQEGMSCS